MHVNTVIMNTAAPSSHVHSCRVRTFTSRAGDTYRAFEGSLRGVHLSDVAVQVVGPLEGGRVKIYKDVSSHTV